MDEKYIPLSAALKAFEDVEDLYSPEQGNTRYSPWSASSGTLCGKRSPLHSKRRGGKPGRQGGRRVMLKLTQSLQYWLFTNHPQKLPLIMFGHLELFTDQMYAEYLRWCQTDEGRQYLKGGSKYVEETE